MLHKIESPGQIRLSLGRRAAERRLLLGLRQRDVAERSGVSRITVARFEATGEAHMSLIILIAIALDAEDGFTKLFPRPDLRTLDEILAAQTIPKRVRVRSRKRRK